MIRSLPTVGDLRGSRWSRGCCPISRQSVRVRQALVRAEARNTTATALLDNPRVGVVRLDRRGRILESNGRARNILRSGDEPDSRHEEPHRVAIGFIGSRLLVVVYAKRGTRRRVISLRKANARKCAIMPKPNPDTTVPTSEEDAAINAGIAADPDTEELDDAWFTRAQPASVVDPDLVERVRRGRGRQKTPTKEQVTIRLDADITAHFRAGGPGWQTRLNNTLRRAVFGRS